MENEDYIIYKHFEEEIEEALIKKLNKEKVPIKKGKWKKKQMNKVCPSILEWKVVTLELYSNKNQQIPKQISHIRFPTLAQLNLWENSIQSVQALSNTYLPSLRQLEIGHNHLTDIRVLRKAMWPSLTHLSIINNFIWEGKVLPQMNIIDIKWVRIEWRSIKQQVYDIKCMLKMEGRQLEILVIGSEKRIVENGLQTTLKDKYKNIQLNQE